MRVVTIMWLKLIEFTENTILYFVQINSLIVVFKNGI